MKSVVLTRFAGPDCLELRNVPDPVPEDGELLVRIEAAGVNFFETLMLSDSYAETPELPARLGVEIAGVVQAVGSDVSPALIGSRVAVPLFATERPFGGYSEFASVPARFAVPIPNELSSAQAVALLVQGLTALHAARCPDLRGKKVLVTAATGGVGSILLQLLRRGGVQTLIACVGNDDKFALAQRLGAHLTVNYRDPEFLGEILAKVEGVDLVFDFVGGGVTESLLELICEGGELIFGALGRASISAFGLENAFGRNLCLRGFALLPLLAHSDVPNDIAHLFELACAGEIEVVVGGTYPLQGAATAHRAFLDRTTTGKIVLDPGLSVER